MRPNDGDGCVFIGGISRSESDDDAVLPPWMSELLDGDTGAVTSNLQGVSELVRPKECLM